MLVIIYASMFGFLPAIAETEAKAAVDAVVLLLGPRIIGVWVWGLWRFRVLARRVAIVGITGASLSAKSTLNPGL